MLISALVAAAARRAAACDVCAVYRATELGESRRGPRLGVAEQLSRFTTLQQGGDEVANPGERLTSSITQVVLGYGVTARLGVQLNLPIISRTYRRLEGGELVGGDETGIGDLALVGHVLAHSLVTERSVFRFSLLGGLELPTGDPDRLAEELDEEHHAAPAAALSLRHPAPRRTLGPRHGTGGDDEGQAATPQAASGIHGHDLALGSGSVDGIVGAALFWSWQRLFLTASGQYAIRTEGAFDYRYANDLTWSAGPGVFPLLAHTYSLGVQALLTGETKGNDTQGGAELDDSAITALYLGPGISFTWGVSLVAEIAADLPLVQNNTGLQIVPDFRLRGGVTWRF